MQRCTSSATIQFRIQLIKHNTIPFNLKEGNEGDVNYAIETNSNEPNAETKSTPAAVQGEQRDLLAKKVEAAVKKVENSAKPAEVRETSELKETTPAKEVKETSSAAPPSSKETTSSAPLVEVKETSAVVKNSTENASTRSEMHSDNAVVSNLSTATASTATASTASGAPEKKSKEDRMMSDFKMINDDVLSFNNDLRLDLPDKHNAA